MKVEKINKRIFSVFGYLFWDSVSPRTKNNKKLLVSVFAVSPACQKELKVLILLDFETNFCPKKIWFKFSSASQLTAFYFKRTFFTKISLTVFFESQSWQASKTKNADSNSRSRHPVSKKPKTNGLIFFINR